jgi:hypothetical protein
MNKAIHEPNANKLLPLVQAAEEALMLGWRKNGRGCHLQRGARGDGRGLPRFVGDQESQTWMAVALGSTLSPRTTREEK